MHPCRIRVALLVMVGVGCVADPGSAQEPRVVAFANVAFVDVASGDSGYGGMAMYGGELVVTLRGAVRAGIDVEVGRITRIDVHYVDIKTVPFRTAVMTPFEFRQTAVTISVFREWPKTARVRYLAGGGLGWLSQRLRGVYFPEMVPWSGNHAPVVLHARGGVVGTVSKHLRIRAEGVWSVGLGVSGILGVRAGIAFVF